MADTMIAVRIHAYGGEEQLRLEEAPMPIPSAGDVVVKVRAASVNPVDWKVREGMLEGILGHQLPLVLGWDFSGEIQSVGEGVTQWQAGDAVYARPDIARDGSYAEYIAVKADEVARKPQTLSWVEAAAVPLAALTAWQSLYDVAQLQAGEKVLVHAGAGGVGHFALQLAKLKGAEVYTTCSDRNADFVKSLGADHVIDYRREDFSELSGLDVVFDTLGGDVQAQSLKCLKPGGRLVSIVDAVDEQLANATGVKGMFWFVQPNADQLAEITDLFEQGKLRVHVDQTFTLEQVAEAHQASREGHTRGKLSLAIAVE